MIQIHSWWIPLVVTIVMLAFPMIRAGKDAPHFPDIVGVFLFLLAIIVSLIAWLIWAILA